MKFAMLKIKIFITFLCAFNLLLPAQDQSSLSEEVNLLLYTSKLYDCHGGVKSTYDRWSYILERNFNYLSVRYSAIDSLYKPNMLDSISGRYEIKLYRILSHNSEDQMRYLLWFKDFSSEVWLRVGGYVENDIHLLFDYLKEDRIRSRQLREMFEQWQTSESLFCEVDWTCLISGYKKNKTNSSCFLSVEYILANDFCINCTLLEEDELYSIFSRLPLYGSFRRYF